MDSGGWGLGTGRSEPIAHLTIDASGQMYGWWASTGNLVRIDKTTGIATQVGAANLFTPLGGLYFDNGGVLYVNRGFDADFWTVDPVLGSTTFLGTVPFPAFACTQAIPANVCAPSEPVNDNGTLYGIN